ncbi:MAG: hypothetical protein IJ192_07660 [Clostridia bacterium]|nr:hypothetical protein [Clostridia bacterium]
MTTKLQNKFSVIVISILLSVIFALPLSDFSAEAVLPIKIESNVTVSSVYVGGKATVKATASNGKAPYQYKFAYKLNSGSWVMIKNYSSSNTATFTMSKAGTYTIRAYTKDKNNAQIYCDIKTTAKVKPTALANKSTIGSTTINLGKTVKVTSKASGGTSPYTYAYYYQLQDGAKKTYKTFSKTATATIKLPAAGYYTVQSVVKDKTGKTVSKTFNVTVKNSTGKALKNSVTTSAASVALGKAVKITSKATGGNQPYQYTYYYSLYGGKYVKATGYSKSAIAYISLPSTGFYSIRSTVKDTSGKTVNAFKAVTVKKVTGKTLTNSSFINTTSTVEKNTTVTMKAKASGGTEPYQYAYYYKVGYGSWNTIKAYSTTESSNLKLSSVGKYTLRVDVKDFAGKVVSKTFTVNSVSVLSVTATKSDVKLVYGRKTKVNITNAGNGALYAVYYKSPSSTQWTTLQNYGTKNEVYFRPRLLGTYQVMVSTKLNNNTTSKTYNVTTYIPDAVYKELNSINEQRVKAGANLLLLDSELVFAAMIRAEEIETQYSHTRPDGTSCFTVLDEYCIDYNTTTGENIAMGFTSIDTVMTAWMNSKGHRENILSKSYTKVGIGLNGIYWSQMYSD